MSSGSTSWFALVLATLGAGAAGSLIATYGGQSCERRKARSEVMACLQRLETARVARPAIEGFDYNEKDMAELSARCLISGIPRPFVSLYELANEAPRHRGRPAARRAGQSPEERDLDEATDMLAYALTDNAAALLARAIWHPRLTPFFRRRERKLRALIIGVFPSVNYPQGIASVLAEWESTRSAWLAYLARRERPDRGADAGR